MGQAIGLACLAFVALVAVLQWANDPADHAAWVAEVNEIRADVAAGRK